MKISKIHLTNFKRFTDLLIDNIPNSSKLVLLIGSNGSGKSSVFDAFDWLSKGPFKGLPYGGDEALNYYRKIQNEEPTALIELNGENVIEKKGLNVSKGLELTKKFIGRSSIRIVPRISNSADPRAISNDADSPITYIENDSRFINDVFAYIQDINNAVREPIFQGKQADTLKIFHDFIAPFNNSLLNIFGGSEKTTIRVAEFQDASPNTNAKLIFQKGDSKINYDLLSHGEKQVVILLLNFIVRRKYYEDSIIFVDEMDCHLNTSLQEKLLDEIVRVWIPDNSQLWTASHALGFINYANKSEQASIVDLNLLDFDVKQIRVPEPKDNPDIYEIAVGKDLLEELFQGYTIFFVEQNDKKYYGQLGIENSLFIPEGGRNGVYHKIKTGQYRGIVDRDFLSDDDIAQIKNKYANLYILKYYSIENLMYHPDNLDEYYLSKEIPFDKEQYITQLTDAKNQVKDGIILRIASDRESYQYFGEPEFAGTAFQKRFKKGQENFDQSAIVQGYLNSDDFETYYKSLPMKSYCTQLLQRQNISKSDLAKMNWFKRQIEKLLDITK